MTAFRSSVATGSEFDVLRPHLRDARLDALFEEQGYVVIPGAARSQLSALRAAHRRTSAGVPAGFQSTILLTDEDRKRAVHRHLLEALRPVLDAVLTGHVPLSTSFVTKGRSDEGAMPPHQDWTFVDEAVGASLNVWTPLIDVDDRNGAMSVLPGSHRMPFTIRGTDTPNPFLSAEEAAIAQMVELPMRAGDVLVHDHRVLHASPPNRRRRPRVVAGCAVLADGAAPIHYRQIGVDRVARYDLDPSFFVEHTFGATDLPSSARWVADIDFEQPNFTDLDLPLASR